MATNHKGPDHATERRARVGRRGGRAVGGMPRRRMLIALAAGLGLLAACGSTERSGSAPSTVPDTARATAPAETTAPATTAPATTAPATTVGDHDGHDMSGVMDPADQAAAMLATAAFQDVKVAETAGYASSLDTLGCFQDPEYGGMGVHYIDQQLLDDQVDIAKPEALVYELDADGHVAGLVAHEYIVPVDAWHSSTPPELFGMAFHRHPTLPLWVLHTWLWKDNPTGMFQDWNPAVRLCPPGVPIFGKDLPAPAATTTTTTPATAPLAVTAGAGRGTRFGPF